MGLEQGLPLTIPVCDIAINGDTGDAPAGSQRRVRGRIRQVREVAGIAFTKPLRVVSLESQVLFSDGTNEVIARGTGYAVRNIRSGRDDGPTFNSPEQAKSEVLKRQPRAA